VWTVTPALILVFLALYQMKMWLRLKAKTPEDNAHPTEIQVLAKQFEWNIRYPGPDNVFGTGDDLLTVAGLVVPVNRPVNVTLRSLDVIHSFFLPNFRFKQDAVPGLTIPFWFRPTKLSADRQPVPDHDGVPRKIPYWDIVCAELCGNSHTNMGAQLYVVSDADYEKWVKDPASVAGLPKWTTWNKANAMGAPDSVWTRWEWQDVKFDEKGRMLTAPAKKKKDPYGPDEPLGAEKKPEDM
jgi:cytochrome c oxidase subunit 2